MGSIEDLHQRKGATGRGGRWRAVPWIAAEAPGGRGRKGPTRTFATYREAERYNDAVERNDTTTLALEFGIGSDRAAHGPKVGFADLALAWADSSSGEWATRKTYASHARTLAAAWPRERVDEVTEAVIGKYFAELADKGRAASTRNCLLVVLRKILWMAVEGGLIERNPAVKVTGPRLSRAPRQRQISEDEAAAARERLPEWFGRALYLGYDMGMRSGEVCGLEWANVDLVNNMITIGPVTQANGQRKGHPKNGEAVTLPLTERAAADLAEQRRLYPGSGRDRVFREPVTKGPAKGTLKPGTNPDRVKKMWAKVRDEIDGMIPDCRWHDLRHGHASRMARAGVPAHVIQAMMRHQSITSTQVYLPAVSPDEMRAAQRRAAEGAVA